MRTLLFVRFFIFSAALLCPFIGRTQSIIIDSLKTIIDKPGTANGERIKAMGQLSKIMAVQNKLGKP